MRTVTSTGLRHRTKVVNTTGVHLQDSDKMDNFIFTVELRLDGELKASCTYPGPQTSFREFEGDDCFVGGEARLWTELPGWYREEFAFSS